MLSSGQSAAAMAAASGPLSMFAGAADANGGGDVTIRRKPKSGGFQTMGLTRGELNSVLRMGFSVPTPIQRKAIPPLMEGCDVVGMARTGSGKTAAYLIPLIHRLAEHSVTVGIRGLVLSPTRELSLQILRELGKLGKHTNLKGCAIVGGNSLEDQFAVLSENPDVVVATPGRLLHIMEESKLQLSAVKCLVLDEADRLFELGLQPQIVAILQKVPEDCQRTMFSATMPSMLADFTEARLHNPVVVRLDAESKLSENLKQSAFFVRSAEKPAALVFLLRRVLGIDAKASQALIFVESKYHVEFFVSFLNQLEIETTGVHGQMDQEARRVAVERFAHRKASAMVVTDVAARGIDLPLLDNVVNYSFPAVPKIFIHRVGRVARAGRPGCAYSILTYDDMPYYVDLLDFIGRPLQTTPTGDQGTNLLFQPDDGCYGRMPDAEIQKNVDYVAHLVEENAELEALFRVMEKAHGKYTRTKKKASVTGIKEARSEADLRFENMPLHPIFAQAQSESDRGLEVALKELRRFKASETYLDMVHGTRLFEIKPKASLQSLRKQREESHDVARAATHPNDEGGKVRPSLAERLLSHARGRHALPKEGPTNTPPIDAVSTSPPHGSEAYQDREYFMPTTREETMHDQHYSVRNAAVDFTADTAEDAAKQRQVFMWNKKKNKYVRTNVNEAKAMLAGIKNEAGKKINFKTKLDSYVKWTHRSNLRIQDVGEQEDAAALARSRSLKHALEEEVGGGDGGDGADDTVDISDPNNGKKLHIGRKLRRLPKDGRTRDFDELRAMKLKKTKENAKLEARRSRKKKGHGDNHGGGAGAGKAGAGKR